MSARMKIGGFPSVAAAVALAASTAAFGEAALPGIAETPAADVTEITSPAEVVLSRILYQRQRALTCVGTTCSGTYAAPAAKQRIELQHVSCIAAVSGGVLTLGQVTYDTAPGKKIGFTLGLGMQSVAGAANIYTLQKDTSMFVPAAKKLAIAIGFTAAPGPPPPTCSIFGQLVTLK